MAWGQALRAPGAPLAPAACHVKVRPYGALAIRLPNGRADGKVLAN